LEEISNIPSILSKKIIKTGKLLQDSTNSQIEEFQTRIKQVSSVYELIINHLIKDEFDHSQAYEYSKKFFGKNSINFVAIDGTEYAKQFFDMVIFYAGASSCFGSINLDKTTAKVEYNDKFLGKGNDVSSCVPIFISKIPEIDHTLYGSNPNKKQKTINMLTEESILDNTNISKSLMTFSEFFLAYRLASAKKVEMILVDGSLSNMPPSLLSDTSNRINWINDCSLLNYEIDSVPLDANDFTLARHHIINELLDLPPARGDYLRYTIFYRILSENQAIGFDDLCRMLKIKDKKVINRVHKYLSRWIEEGVIEKLGEKYTINNKYTNSWSQIKRLVISIGDQIFDGEKDPFIVSKTTGHDGELKKEWITTTDLAFLTLFSLYMLIEECWKNNILLLGISKDTTAQDFKNHLLPIGLSNSLWNDDENINSKIQGEIDKIPYSDRTILQSLSLLNYERITIPWSLIEYDAAFRMAIPDIKNRKGYLTGAVKNKITASKLFLRSFVQLEQAKTNPMLRSNVLSIDRLVYPSLDLSPRPTTDDNIFNFKHEYIGEEEIQFVLYKNHKTKNELQNLIMIILNAMGSPSIAESFGHNKALYIADKVAKWHNEEFRNIVDSTNILISCHKDLKNFVFYMNSFRERRHMYESNRRL
jgi:hypothetical protein